jgi:hypothetical protein
MRLLTLLLLPLALAACMGDEEPALVQSDLPTLVLQQEDLSGDWIQFTFNPPTRADGPTGARADPTRFGRTAGWLARYRRPPDAQESGAFVVESRVDLFETSGGADDELEAARAELMEAEQAVDAPELGDEAAAGEAEQQVLSGGVRFYTFVWRHENVAATLVVQAFEEGFRVEEAVALARRQAERITTALGAKQAA